MPSKSASTARSFRAAQVKRADPATGSRLEETPQAVAVWSAATACENGLRSWTPKQPRTETNIPDFSHWCPNKAAKAN